METQTVPAMAVVAMASREPSSRYLVVTDRCDPCATCRGIYTYVYATAISWDGKNLTEEWRHSSYKGNSITTNATGTHNQKLSLYGQGCHAGQAADLDGDGYDEVCIGAATIDHDGTVLVHGTRSW